MSEKKKICPKCQNEKEMVTNGLVHAIPAYNTGTPQAVSQTQLAPVVLFACPECRYVEMYLGET
jgi:hypothetical protein